MDICLLRIIIILALVLIITAITLGLIFGLRGQNLNGAHAPF